MIHKMKDNKYYESHPIEFADPKLLYEGEFPENAGDHAIDNIKHEIEEYDSIRVKYLDREDIESLGFKCIVDEEYHKMFERGDINDSKLVIEWVKWYVGNLLPEPHSKTTEHRQLKVYQTEGTPIRTQDGYEGVSKDMFKGTVKNKSELKRLLKQLGVSEV